MNYLSILLVLLLVGTPVVHAAPVPTHLMPKDPYPPGFKFWHNGYLVRVKHLETNTAGIRTCHLVYDSDGRSYSTFTVDTIRETLRTHRQDWLNPPVGKGDKP